MGAAGPRPRGPVFFAHAAGRILPDHGIASRHALSRSADKSDRVPGTPYAGRVAVTTGRLLSLIWGAAVTNKGLVIAVITLGVLQAAFTKAPIALLEPMLRALGAQEGANIDPGMLQPIIDFFGLDSDSEPMNMLMACAIVSLILAVPGALAIYGVLLLSRYFATKIVVDLRDQVAQHLLLLPLRFFGRRRMGELISNFTNDTAVLARSFALVCDHIVVDPLLIAGNAVLLAFFVPEAIPILVVMVPAMALPLLRLGRRITRTSSSSLAAMGDATESMNQMLSGIRTVKAFQLEKERQSDFAGSNARFLQRTRKMLRAKALAHASVHVAYHVALAGLLVLLGWVIIEQGEDFSVIGVAVAALATSYTHVKRLTRAYNTLKESTGALEGIEALLMEPHDPAGRAAGLPVPSLRGEVELDGVCFAYDEEPVLREISFKVEPGQTVALVGPSGAGKSTTLDLLARFYDPTAGSIRIDGLELCKLSLTDYRRQIAIVSQQPFLFNAGIRDNILCGRPGAPEADVERAARAAQIHDFIAALPDGYDSVAGERGCKLSGGQMQRITIARAILRNPRILFLDEATSALDSESEELVQKALQNLMAGRTSFVIAHRLSTIASADLIVVLEAGRVVEQGTHQELVERRGVYKRMRDLQAAP